MVIRNVKGQFVEGMNIVDKSGERYGRLKVESLSDKRSGRKTFWNCICDCGNRKVVRSDSLGKVNSCGCLKKEMDKINLTAHHSHKQSGDRIYHTWQGMKSRCYYDKNERFKRYGGRGIKVCAEWLNSFDNFYKWAIENGYTEDMTIERKDIDGDYEPSNCEWITAAKQARNKSNTLWVEYENEMISLGELSEITGLNYGTLRNRVVRGLKGNDLISPPMLDFKKKKHGNNNLLESEVKEIKYLLRRGLSQTEIAKLYNVTKYCINDIKTERTWKHVQAN